MNRSYLGVVTRKGLEALFQEEDHVIRFLHRRVYRRRPFDGFCCWAVMSDEIADQIELQIEFGDYFQALRTLQSHAMHWGASLPNDSESYACA
jgi:hypothetical protein